MNQQLVMGYDYLFVKEIVSQYDSDIDFSHFTSLGEFKIGLSFLISI
jgi:hypothetical protein